MKSQVRRACGILMLFFPFYVYLLDLGGAPRWWCLLLVTAGLLVHFSGNSLSLIGVRIAAVALPAVALYAVRADNMARIYPFVISLHYWLMFLNRRADGRSALEVHVARVKPLQAWERPMLRKATLIWQVGLAPNTLALFVLMFAYDTRIWMLYAGLVSYFYLGFLFLVTLVYGFFFHKNWASCPEPSES